MSLIGAPHNIFFFILILCLPVHVHVYVQWRHSPECPAISPWYLLFHHPVQLHRSRVSSCLFPPILPLIIHYSLTTWQLHIQGYIIFIHITKEIQAPRTSDFSRKNVQERIWGLGMHPHIRIAYPCKINIKYTNKKSLWRRGVGTALPCVPNDKEYWGELLDESNRTLRDTVLDAIKA